MRHPRTPKDKFFGIKWDRNGTESAAHLPEPSPLDADDVNVEVSGKAHIVHRERVIPNPSPGAYI